jgi:hypothetical protein
MSFPKIHRVITGHDANGKAVITSSSALPTVVELKAMGRPKCWANQPTTAQKWHSNSIR